MRSKTKRFCRVLHPILLGKSGTERRKPPGITIERLQFRTSIHFSPSFDVLRYQVVKEGPIGSVSLHETKDVESLSINLRFHIFIIG